MSGPLGITGRFLWRCPYNPLLEVPASDAAVLARSAMMRAVVSCQPSLACAARIRPSLARNLQSRRGRPCAALNGARRSLLLGLLAGSLHSTANASQPAVVMAAANPEIEQVKTLALQGLDRVLGLHKAMCAALNLCPPNISATPSSPATYPHGQAVVQPRSSGMRLPNHWNHPAGNAPGCICQC